jgi:superfamily II DNA or RNA helicase
VSITLRAYQLDAIQQARDRIEAGRIAPLLVAPTGAGKTLIMGSIVMSHLDIDAENRVLIVAHRRELIGQMAKTLMRMGVPMHDIGEIIPGVTYRPSARVQVASVQTLRARNMMPKATLVVYDEAHHYSADDWHELTQGYPGVLRVGFTATPMRGDGRGMSPAFDSLVVVSTIKELTALKFLVPCRVIAPGKPLKRPNMTHSPAEAYLAHAKGMRTVVFADYVANAEKFVAEFLEAGIEAVVVHGSMPDPERKRALAAHDRGAVLVNCMVLTEGWDSPETSCCILARGCGSVGTYLQIVGRVLRPSPGKSEALLIDLTGRSFHDHGAPDTDRKYSLTGKGIRTQDEIDADQVYCPVCGQPVEAMPNSWPCAVCGHQPVSQIEAPVYTGDELAERYSGKRSEDDEKRIDTLARWYSEAKARGNRPWAALAKYNAVYGSPPTESIRIQADALARTLACVACRRCGKVTARTYQGGLCGRCAFNKPKEKA